MVICTGSRGMQGADVSLGTEDKREKSEPAYFGQRDEALGKPMSGRMVDAQGTRDER